MFMPIAHIHTKPIGFEPANRPPHTPSSTITPKPTSTRNSIQRRCCESPASYPVVHHHASSPHPRLTPVGAILMNSAPTFRNRDHLVATLAPISATLYLQRNNINTVLWRKKFMPLDGRNFANKRRHKTAQDLRHSNTLRPGALRHKPTEFRHKPGFFCHKRRTFSPQHP